MPEGDAVRSVQNQTGRKSILLSIVAIVILAVIAAFLVLYKNAAPSSPHLNTVSPTLTAIPKKITWKTYVNPGAGFSLKYPDTVRFESETGQTVMPELVITAEKLTDIPEDMPSFMGRKDALAQKEMLEKSPGVTAYKLGTLQGGLDMPLSRFEICSVILTRSITFYPKDYRVIIYLYGPEDAIMDSMPEYFTVDQKNCGSQRMWNKDRKPTFKETLEAGKGRGAAQQWYDTFDEIIKTITITDAPTATIVPVQNIPAGMLIYKNFTYGFEVNYPDKYKALDSKEDLYGYPNAAALIYGGGQVYDVVIEVWNSKADYETEYGPRVSDLTVFEKNGKFITVLDNGKSPESKQIISSFKLTTN